MTGFIDAHRDVHPVDVICKVLEFPASTYYAARKRVAEPWKRSVRDKEFLVEIRRVWEAGKRLYGA